MSQRIPNFMIGVLTAGFLTTIVSTIGFHLENKKINKKTDRQAGRQTTSNGVNSSAPQTSNTQREGFES